jgi:hypothetical protein
MSERRPGCERSAAAAQRIYKTQSSRTCWRKASVEEGADSIEIAAAPSNRSLVLDGVLRIN